MRGALVALVAVLAAVGGPGAPAGAISLRDRTFIASLADGGASADGASTRPAVSAAGQVVAFDSVATNLTADPNGAIRDVFARSQQGETVLVSIAPGGTGGDGASYAAAVGGSTIAFESDASNLVAGDGNGTTDVFARVGAGPVQLVSAALGGASADGRSGSADVSGNGRTIVFVSSATNLVPGDRNGVADVFVRDLATGVTRRISPSRDRGEANGASAAPSISGDGRYVVFASRASNLVPGDTNGVQDVFRVDLAADRVTRVSVSTRGDQQDEAVMEPRSQMSGISRDGRYVVFDSDAANLAPRDRNRATDIFVRDLRAGRTLRISVDEFGVEADDDSFNPTLSGNGRYVVFASSAERLAPGDGPGEDVFIYDLRTFAPSVISVGTRGARRLRERGRDLMQRPAVTDRGNLVAFTSTASNLAPRDRNAAEDVFLRITAPPRARIARGPRGVVRERRPRLRLRADDPQARDFICRLDRVRIRCGRNGRLPRLARGPHVLRVLAGGPGMLFQRTPVVRRFRVR